LPFVRSALGWRAYRPHGQSGAFVHSILRAFLGILGGGGPRPEGRGLRGYFR
jgi:hypothetical protein